MVQSSKSGVSWATCGNDGHWCNFLLVDLDSDSLSKGGVYVIWSENTDGSRKRAVYVGQGKPIADCLARHRDEVNITRHGSNGRVLRATWAKVGKQERGGAERYLADTLMPLEGDRWSDEAPVAVNLPW
jgi:hypothetical protein